MFKEFLGWLTSLDVDIVVALIGGVSTLLAAFFPSLVIFTLSRRYLSCKQSDRSCLNALEELSYTQEVLNVLRKNPELSYLEGKAQVNEAGLRSNGLFSPSKMHVKLRTYRRKVDETLPMI